MSKSAKPLSEDADRQVMQNNAIVELEEALKHCEEAGVVFIRDGYRVYAFDEDRLFASGWTPSTPIKSALDELGERELNTYDRAANSAGNQGIFHTA